jgi:uncharacterized protein (DUF934 family)
MALIKREGPIWSFTDDPYTAVADDAALPDGAICVSLARFQAERDALLARNSPLAVTLSSDQSPETIGDDLARISAVFLQFPKFRDGRGYSWARVLRQRMGYRGEVRAVGDVLRDQWLPMHRCGIDAMAVRDGVRMTDFLAALSEQTVFYQPSQDGRGRIGRTPARAMAAAE